MAAPSHEAPDAPPRRGHCALPPHETGARIRVQGQDEDAQRKPVPGRHIRKQVEGGAREGLDR
eukprot:7946320-Lingulodinium_polyedra.AAC.1